MWNQDEFTERLNEISEDDFENALSMMLEDGVLIKMPEHVQEILRSFQRLNKSIVFLDDETATKDVNSRIYGICSSFTMPVSFAIQNLNKLLLALKSVNTNEIVIYNEYIKISKFNEEENKLKEMIVHHHDNFNLINCPYNDYVKHDMNNVYEMMGIEKDFSNCDISFDLNSVDMKSIKEANRIMDGKQNEIIFEFKDNKMSINISDEADDAGDIWRTETEIDYDQDEFELVYRTVDLDKLVYGDYTVYAYQEGIAGFRLKPIEVDGQMIDLGLTYIATTGRSN